MLNTCPLEIESLRKSFAAHRTLHAGNPERYRPRSQGNVSRFRGISPDFREMFPNLREMFSGFRGISQDGRGIFSSGDKYLPVSGECFSLPDIPQNSRAAPPGLSAVQRNPWAVYLRTRAVQRNVSGECFRTRGEYLRTSGECFWARGECFWTRGEYPAVSGEYLTSGRNISRLRGISLDRGEYLTAEGNISHQRGISRGFRGIFFERGEEKTLNTGEF